MFKIWMPGVFTAEELDKIGGAASARRRCASARATRLAMLVTDPAILRERMLAKKRAIEEGGVRRREDAESRKYKNKMRSGGMRDEWEAAAAAEAAALAEAEAEAAAKAAAASGSSDAAPMRTRAKSTSRDDKLGDDGTHRLARRRGVARAEPAAHARDPARGARAPAAAAVPARGLAAADHRLARREGPGEDVRRAREGAREGGRGRSSAGASPAAHDPRAGNPKPTAVGCSRPRTSCGATRAPTPRPPARRDRAKPGSAERKARPR